MSSVPSGQTLLYLLYLPIKAICILVMSLIGGGSKPCAGQYKPHVPCCSYKPHETKEGGGERRTGHQFNPDMSRFKHSAEGGLGSNTKRPPQSHPVVSPKTNGLAASQKNGSNYGDTQNNSILLCPVFEL